MNEQTKRNTWHRSYKNGTGRVEQFGPTSYLGSFTPYEPKTGNAPTAERPDLRDAMATVDSFAGPATDEWVPDKVNA